METWKTVQSSADIENTDSGFPHFHSSATTLRGKMIWIDLFYQFIDCIEIVKGIWKEPNEMLRFSYLWILYVGTLQVIRAFR